MKIKAYIPIKFNNDTVPALVTDELILSKKELIKFTPKADNYTDWGFNKVERQPYTFQLKHKAEEVFTYEPSDKYISISFLKNGKAASIYILSKHLFKLKWINGLYWIQRDGNTWKVSNLFIGFALGVLYHYLLIKYP